MLYPEFITKGKTIGVTSPSDGKTDKLDLIRLDNAYKKLKNLGYEIVETPNVRKSIKGRSANAKLRAKYLEDLFQDDNVKVIISAGGGDFLVEILPYLDFNILKNNPKWFCGFSDNTAIGFILTTKLDIASLYSDNISCFGMEPWHESINNYLKILQGDIIEQSNFTKYQSSYSEYKTGLESYTLDKEVSWNNLNNEKTINLEGRLIGGCLDVLLNLVGTKYDYVKEFIEKYKNDGIIWFLESCELTSEQLIRGLWQLKEAGWFKYTKGFIFGRPILEKSYYSINYEEALKESLQDLNVPIITSACFGHTSPKITIINGSYTKITSQNKKGTIKMELK